MPSPHDSYIVDASSLPELFPTHIHDPSFWEALGRVVATFGFLEEVLGKAIFALTATTSYPPEKIEKAFREWSKKLERALHDPLGGLIASLEKELQNNKSVTLINSQDLIADLRKAAEMRNVLCHGSWRRPDSQGRSALLFVDKKLRKFDTKVDVEFLLKVQRHTIELAVSVINTVTHMGWQFPGTNGPGSQIFQRPK